MLFPCEMAFLIWGIQMKKSIMTLVIILMMALLFNGCKSTEEKTEMTTEETSDNVDQVEDEKSSNQDTNGNQDTLKKEEMLKDTSEQDSDEKDEQNGTESEKETPVAVHGKLSVKDTQLVDANGDAYQIQGVSTHGINWFPEYINKEGFQSMRDDWGINCVRIAMYTAESESYCEGGNKEQLKTLVKQGVDYATELGMYVIIDWHILHDLDPNKYKQDAIAFFDEMSELYADYDNVLYEICNEPNGGTSWSQVKDYANEVIPVIKEHDPNAVIIVGTPTWSQDVDLAAMDPIEGYDNIMYTIHFYADTHRDNIRQKMEKALAAGIPVFCTEFGVCDASGSGANNFDEGNKWIQAMDDNGVSYCIWNLSNKNETSSLIKSGCIKKSGWTKDDLSEAGVWYIEVLGKDVNEIGKTSPSDNAAEDTKDAENNGNNTATENETNNKSVNSNKSNDNNNDNETTADDKKIRKDSDKSKNSESKSGNLKVSINCSNHWSDGSKEFYQYDVKIQNDGSSAVDGWNVQLDFEQSITIDQSWNGNYVTSGNSITIQPVDYNQKIEAGQSVDMGLIIKTSQTQKTPNVSLN